MWLLGVAVEAPTTFGSSSTSIALSANISLETFSWRVLLFLRVGTGSGSTGVEGFLFVIFGLTDGTWFVLGLFVLFIVSFGLTEGTLSSASVTVMVGGGSCLNLHLFLLSHPVLVTGS